jgi:hypothetical protein
MRMTDELLEQDMDLDPPPTGPTCGSNGGRTKAGTACRSTLNLSPTSGMCVQHDPDRADQARALWAMGGRASGERKRRAKAALPEGVPSAPRCLEDAVKFASWLTRAIADGTIDARTGHESAYALNCFKAAAEKRDLERQVADLQAQLKAFKSQRPRVA